MKISRLMSFVGFIVLAGGVTTRAALDVRTMPSFADNFAFGNAVRGKPINVWGVAFTGTAPYNYTLDFGDGTSATGTAADPKYIGVSHTYYTIGNKTMTLTVTDGTGTTDSSSSLIRVFPEDTFMIRNNRAIDEGLLYLYKSQYADGSWRSTGYYNNVHQGLTGLCTFAFVEKGLLPFSGTPHPYQITVQRALQYMMVTSARVGTMAIPAHSDGVASRVSDSNGNGLGVFLNNNGDHDTYQSAMVMLALSGCFRDAAEAQAHTVSGGALNGWRYYDVISDAIEQFIWAQGDGTYRGSWEYSLRTQSGNRWDGSAIQWPPLAMLIAEKKLGITTPQWAKDNVLYAMSQLQDVSTGGFGYGSATQWRNIGKTGGMLAVWDWAGVPSTNVNVQRAVNFLRNYYLTQGTTTSSGQDLRGWSGDLYAMYSMKKGLDLIDGGAGIETLLTTAGVRHWYEDLVYYLTGEAAMMPVGLVYTASNDYAFGQKPDGGWNSNGWPTEATVVGRDLATAWATLTLIPASLEPSPVAEIIPVSPQPAGTPFQVDGSTSFHMDSAHSLIEWAWDFDASDGVDFVTPDAYGQRPTVPGYPAPGTYTITLRVKDDNDPALTSTDTITVTVNAVNHPPIAKAIPDARLPGYGGNVGIPIQLDGTASYDPDVGDSIALYEWDLDGDGAYDDSTLPNPTVTYMAPFQGQVGLRVRDSNGVYSQNLSYVDINAAYSDIAVVSMKADNILPGDTEVHIRVVFTNNVASVQGFSNVLVRFYDGNPFTDGNRFGPNYQVNLPVGDDAVLDINLPIPANLEDVYVFLDANTLIPEWDESNNVRRERIPYGFTTPDDITVDRNRPPPGLPTNNQVEFDALANDVEFWGLGYDLKITGLNPPSHGTVELLADGLGQGAPGTIRYTPAPGYYGPDYFEYVIDDGQGGVDTGKVYVHVNDTDGDGDGVLSQNDCDDNDPTVFPGAPEICDGKDNDCDGVVPSEEVDDDEDGFAECVGDCNDSDPTIYPGAPEIAGDGIDQDCNGQDLILDIVCPGNISRPNDPGVCGAAVNYPPPVVLGGVSTETTQTLNYTGAIQSFVVPAGVTSLTLEAFGAQGKSAQAGRVGGRGARMKGTFAVTPGEQLLILVGGEGLVYLGNGGGGGGSFIVRVDPGSAHVITSGPYSGTRVSPLLVAGGGGGTRATVDQDGNPGVVSNYGTTGSGNSTSGGGSVKTSELTLGGIVSSISWGSGGGGFLGDGQNDSPYGTGGRSFLGGGAGGTELWSSGGLAIGGLGGGGGGGNYGGGGGGGYSGGDGGRVAGGGGSWNAGTDPDNAPGVREGNGQVVISYGSASVNVVQTAGLPSGATFPVGTTVNTFVVTDGAGNTATCSFEVTVADTEFPVFACPSDAVYQCAAQVPPPAPPGAIPVTDNCGSSPVTMVNEVLTGNFPCDYRLERTYESVDSAGNRTACTQVILVKDTLGPVITPPPNRVVEYGSPTDVAATGSATALDNCTGAVTPIWEDVSDVWNNAGCGLLGPQVVHVITRRWTAVDNCGNVSTHDQVITVMDRFVPRLSILTPTEVTIECSQGAMTPVPVIAPAPEGTTRIPAAYDNPAPVPAVMTYVDATNLVSACAYDVVRTWTATDRGCNTTVFVQTIHVRDTRRPTVHAPPLAVVEYGGATDPAATGMATANDECDGAPVITWTDATNTLACAYNYDIARTWRATDACGNTHTAVQVIQVRDTTPPVISSPYVGSASWTQIGQDMDGEADYDFSGFSVSLSADGNRLAVGAIYNSGNVSSSGHTRVYAWNGSGWTQLGGDLDGEAAFDSSGVSVSLSADGNRLAIGAPSNDGNGPDSGHTRVYAWNGSGWAQLGGDLDGEAADDFSGTSVSLSADGNRLAVGSPGNDGNGLNSGHTRVYAWNGSGWIQLGGDLDGEADLDYSGHSVSLSADGNRLAVGAPSNDGNAFDSGHTRVYAWNGSGWTQLGGDLDGEAAVESFGDSVSLSADGNRLAVGAPINSGNGLSRGRTRVYAWNGSGWTQLGGDLDGEADNDFSGNSVSLSADGNRLAVGAMFNSGNGISRGHTRVYTWNGSGWTQIGGDLDGEADNDFSGHSVSLSADGNRLAVGAPNNGGNGSWRGHARVYELPPAGMGTPPADITVECGDSTDPSATGQVTATDSTGYSPLITWRDSTRAGNCVGRSVITRTWTATDACGNTAEHVQLITVVDTTPPVLTAPGPVTVELGASVSPSHTGQATALDACSLPPVPTYSDKEAQGTGCPVVRVITRTWTAVDSCGNPATAEQVITVVDTTPPAVVWPADQTVVAGAPTDPPGTGTPFATDAGGPPAVSHVDATAPHPDCPEGQVIQRTWTVTDGCNPVTHVQTITVGSGQGRAAWFVEQPQSQTVALGQPATFSVSVIAECGASYQWMRNGAPIPGATAASYTHPAAQPEDNGAQFACRVRTGVTIQSLSAMLTVTGASPAPAPLSLPELQVELDPAAPGIVVFRFPTEEGFLYRLQAKAADGDEWLNLSVEYPGDGQPVELLLPAADLPSGMFRLMVVPMPQPQTPQP